MTVAPLERAVSRVCERVRDADPDADLLARFCRERDAAAFAALVRRHGPAVLGVCRRVLGDHHAAEDAFQAAFLVLARKAAAVRPPGAVGPWLHGVAYRTALKARGRASRRRAVERAYAGRVVNERREPRPPDFDLRAVVDEHLSALPERYRLPLLLCGVQGLGKAEAAARLGVPEGTVSSRLARGRELLRDRLARRGVVVPAAAVAGVFASASPAVAVSPALVATTAGAGVAFAAGAVVGVSPSVLSVTHEVLRAMTLLKWKLLSVLTVSGLLAGGSFGLYPVRAADNGNDPTAIAALIEKDKKKGDEDKDEKKGDGEKAKGKKKGEDDDKDEAKAKGKKKGEDDDKGEKKGDGEKGKAKGKKGDGETGEKKDGDKGKKKGDEDGDKDEKGKKGEGDKGAKKPGEGDKAKGKKSGENKGDVEKGDKDSDKG